MTDLESLRAMLRNAKLVYIEEAGVNLTTVHVGRVEFVFLKQRETLYDVSAVD
jgi:hypothetical protein